MCVIPAHFSFWRIAVPGILPDESQKQGSKCQISNTRERNFVFGEQMDQHAKTPVADIAQGDYFSPGSMSASLTVCSSLSA